MHSFVSDVVLHVCTVYVRNKGTLSTMWPLDILREKSSSKIIISRFVSMCVRARVSECAGAV